MSQLVDIVLVDQIIKSVAVENYDHKKMRRELDNSKKRMIAIGDTVVQRYSVIKIVPIVN